MAKAREAHPSLRFAWVDIEDHADALDDPDNAAADIESFPTILLVHADTPHFFGTVLPHAAVLDRLILQALAGELPPVVAPAARRLAVAVARLALNEPEATRIA